MPQENWMQIHPDFAKKDEWIDKNYQQKWEELGLTYQDAQEWLLVGLKIREFDLVSQLKIKGFAPQQFASKFQERRNAQEWVDFFYPQGMLRTGNNTSGMKQKKFIITS